MAEKAGQGRAGCGHPRVQLSRGAGAELPPFSPLPSAGLESGPLENLALGLVARIRHGPA